MTHAIDNITFYVLTHKIMSNTDIGLDIDTTDDILQEYKKENDRVITEISYKRMKFLGDMFGGVFKDVAELAQGQDTISLDNELMEAVMFAERLINVRLFINMIDCNEYIIKWMRSDLILKLFDDVKHRFRIHREIIINHICEYGTPTAFKFFEIYTKCNYNECLKHAMDGGNIEMFKYLQNKCTHEDISIICLSFTRQLPHEYETNPKIVEFIVEYVRDIIPDCMLFIVSKVSHECMIKYYEKLLYKDSEEISRIILRSLCHGSYGRDLFENIKFLMTKITEETPIVIDNLTIALNRSVSDISLDKYTDLYLIFERYVGLLYAEQSRKIISCVFAKIRKIIHSNTRSIKECLSYNSKIITWLYNLLNVEIFAGAFDGDESQEIIDLISEIPFKGEDKLKVYEYLFMNCYIVPYVDITEDEYIKIFRRVINVPNMLIKFGKICKKFPKLKFEYMCELLTRYELRSVDTSMISEYSLSVHQRRSDDECKIENKAVLNRLLDHVCSVFRGTTKYERDIMYWLCNLGADVSTNKCRELDEKIINQLNNTEPTMIFDKFVIYMNNLTPPSETFGHMF